MCYSCYTEDGSPSIINDKTLQAAKLIEEVFEYSDVGGNAHVVIDDWNVSNDTIDWCLNVGIPGNVHEAGIEQLAIEYKCLQFLLELNYDERVSALAIYEEILDLPVV